MLPEGWAAYKAEDGMEYYHNAALNVTQWEKPTLIGAPKIRQDFLPPSPTVSTADLESGKPTSSANLEVFDTAKASALQYFDVTTNEIKDRLILASLPHRLWASTQDQQTSVFAQKPDFYGPLWIAITAAFALFAGGHAYAWASNMLLKTSFVTVYVSFALIGLWLSIVPFIVRTISMWNGGSDTVFRLEHIFCVYGYSLWPLIPVAILSALPSKVLQIVFALAGLGVSLAFLGITLFKDMAQVPQPARVWLVGVMGILQFVLFMLLPTFFFRLPASGEEVLASPASPAM
eukprot:Gregarina_sp_Pseudo_9__1989@NODE_2379_length_1018_cov_34_225741_g2191_i0_p1_GENE_NODE_2379_length_1018_cov_34_225741_g2191_i0NODE_2379_length_1018_cov_34_225741_g2191_i0_p1_ORF_typecomplete_len321_score33_39Yip1/PF04893_17/5_2e17WW/PF00397_26/1_4e07YIF1/PF03878_15/3_1e06DUF872/PF05915_12/48DUF872/PF05915_12/13_NODE_2379_length_1018_cov_34_225741_g2191_i054923